MSATDRRLHSQKVRWRKSDGTFNIADGWFFMGANGHPVGPYNNEQSALDALESTLYPQANIQRIHREVVEEQLYRARKGLLPDVTLALQDAEDLNEFLADFAYD